MFFQYNMINVSMPKTQKIENADVMALQNHEQTNAVNAPFAYKIVCQLMTRIVSQEQQPLLGSLALGMLPRP
jgi:hypothetical protein